MHKDWLSPVKSALDSREACIEIFFRDDDAGWNNERLMALLDAFRQTETPIDLAIIPEATDKRLADLLLERQQADKRLLGIHQHGFSHTNHELEGRKCEFGAQRSKLHQFNDIAQGKKHLADLFESAVDPIFTPPWNRCTEITANCLKDLNFRALSRNRAADSLELNGLHEIPVDIDWCGIRSRSPSPWTELGEKIAANLRISATKPVGIMLHHAVMDEEDLEQIKSLLLLIRAHKSVHLKLMRDFLATH